MKSNEKAVLSFEEGLSNEVIKRKISQKNYKLLSEAVTFASELEKTVGTNTSNSETTNTPRTGCRICKIPGHSTDQCYKLGRMLSIDTTSDYCSYCRRHGHKIADCRTKRYAEGISYQNGNQNNGNLPVNNQHRNDNYSNTNRSSSYTTNRNNNYSSNRNNNYSPQTNRNQRQPQNQTWNQQTTGRDVQNGQQSGQTPYRNPFERTEQNANINQTTTEQEVNETDQGN